MAKQPSTPRPENDGCKAPAPYRKGAVAPFVGAARQRLVEALVSQFDRARKTATPCWVSIEGAAGTGKTRLVHEAYARLAAAQGTRPYWPPRLESGVQTTTVPVRKRVAPAWNGSPGAVTPWFWWGLHGLSQHGDPIATLAVALEQFAEHEAPLEEAWRRRAAIGRRLLGALPDTFVAAGEEGGVEGVAHLTGRVAGMLTGGVVESVIGVGAAVRAARATRAHRRHARTRHEAVRVGVPIAGMPSADPVNIAINLIGRVAYDATVPVIVFVEDLHEADELLVELIDRILQLEGRAVLIVTTGVTGGLEADERFAPLRAWRERHGVNARLQWMGEGVPPVSAPQVLGELAPLAFPDLERIVHHTVPGVAPSAANALVQRYRRPLLLEMVAGDPELVELYGPDLATITAADVAELPADVDAYLRRAFERLPPRSREVLRAAAAALPHRITPYSSASALDGRRDFLLSALDEEDDLAAKCVSEWPPSLEAWLETSELPRYSFREWSELEVVAHPPLRSAVKKKICRALAHRAIAFFKEASVDEDTDYPERLVLALHASAELNDRSTIRAATLRRLYRLSGSTRESVEALRLGALYLEHADDTASSEALIVRNNLAMVQARAGETGLAIAELGKILEILRREPSLLPLDRLTILANLGDMMMRADQHRDALPVLREAFAAHEVLLGATDSRTLWLRSQLAVCMAHLGPVDRAQEDLEQVLALVEQQFDPLDPLVLSIREDLLRVRALTEPAGSLIEDHQSLADDIGRAFGAEHPNTLGARQAVAVLRGRSGDLGAAADESYEIYLLRVRVLGARAPSTLSSFHDAVSMLGEMGQYDEAITRGTTLLRIQSEVLDRDHPNLLATRHNVGLWTVLSGKPLAGVVDLHALWQDHERISGRDAPRTLAIEAYVGQSLVLGGYPDSGRLLLLDVIARMRRVLPCDHPSLLEAQGWLDD